MATFNPEPNPINANYLGYSRGTQGAHIPNLREPGNLQRTQRIDYPVNKGAASAIANVAETVGPFTKSVREAYVEGIKNDYYKDVEPVVNQFNEDLQQAVNSASTPDLFKAHAEVTDAPDTSVPDDIVSFEREAAKLNQARAGKYLTESQFYLTLESKLQGIREKYPGYRDEVDSIIKSKLGFDPANRRWQANLNALTSMAAAASSSASADQKQLRKDLEDAEPAMAEAYIKGGPNAPTKGQIAANAILRRGAKNNISLIQADLNLKQDARKDTEEDYSRVFSNLGKDQVGQAYNDLAIRSEGALKQYLETGKVPEGKDLDAVVQQMSVWRDSIYQSQRNLRNAPANGKDGPTFASRISPEKLDKLVSSNLEQVDELYNAFVGKDFKRINSIATVLKSVEDRSKLDLMNSNGRIARTYALSQQMGPAFANITLGAGGTGIMKMFQEYIAGVTLEQPGAMSTKTNTEQVFGKDRPLSVEEHRTFIDEPVRELLDPQLKNTDIKTKRAFYLSSADTWAYIAAMPPKTREITFNQLVNPEVAKAVHSLNNPQADAQYTKFAESYFRLTAGSAAATLQEAKDSGTVEIKYNPTANSIETKVPDAQRRMGRREPSPSVIDATNRINVKLKQIEPILKKAGHDPQILLQISGFDTREAEKTPNE